MSTYIIPLYIYHVYIGLFCKRALQKMMSTYIISFGSQWCSVVHDCSFVCHSLLHLLTHIIPLYICHIYTSLLQKSPVKDDVYIHCSILHLPRI